MYSRNSRFLPRIFYLTSRSKSWWFLSIQICILIWQHRSLWEFSWESAAALYSAQYSDINLKLIVEFWLTRDLLVKEPIKILWHLVVTSIPQLEHRNPYVSHRLLHHKGFGISLNPISLLKPPYSFLQISSLHPNWSK